MSGLKVSSVSNFVDPMGWHVGKVMEEKGYSDEKIKKKNWARKYVADPGNIYGEDPKSTRQPPPTVMPPTSASIKTEKEKEDKVKRYKTQRTNKRRPIMTLSSDDTLG